MAFSLAGLLLAGFNITTTTVHTRTLGFFWFEIVIIALSFFNKHGSYMREFLSL